MKRSGLATLGLSASSTFVVLTLISYASIPASNASAISIPEETIKKEAEVPDPSSVAVAPTQFRNQSGAAGIRGIGDYVPPTTAPPPPPATGIEVCRRLCYKNGLFAGGIDANNDCTCNCYLKISDYGNGENVICGGQPYDYCDRKCLEAGLGRGHCGPCSRDCVCESCPSCAQGQGGYEPPKKQP